MMVLTATQSGSLKDEMVGRCRAGSCAITVSRSARFTFSISPTRPCAAIAAFSSSAMVSIFSRFHGSSMARGLATSCVLLSINVSMMRRRLARSVEPVSVASTIASASTGGFTSVAPHENSTSTSASRALNHCCVTRTSSVATRLPFRSCAVLNGESSGTASTHFTVPKLCLE